MLDYDKLQNTKSCEAILNTNPTNEIKEIERSIIKKYRANLWSPFMKGISEFDLIKEGDKIAVCVSGGKDSLLMAKMFQELQKHGDTKFEVIYIAMNPGFSEGNLNLLKNTCAELGIDIDIFDTQIFEIVEKISKKYPCYMCAKMRRGAIYEYASQQGCNKIALGHHYNDFIETAMLNILYAGSFKAMVPKIKAKNYQNMELIRPLVYVKEENIIKYTKGNNIKAMDCGCVVAAKKTSSKRAEVKQLIKQLKQINPDVEKSIFASTKNVNLTSVLGWNVEGKRKSFNDLYNEDFEL